MSDTLYLSFLYEALRAEYGVVISCSDPSRLRQKLYPLRKSSPEFEPLSFVLSPISPTDLWIIRHAEV